MSESPDSHDEFRRSMMERMNAERRIGTHAGAGPKGARVLSHEELPDEPSALKMLYMEQQRALQDAHAQHFQEKEKLRWGGEETLEDLLSHIWNRGLEFGGVLAALSFIAMVFAPAQFTSTELTVGVFAVAAFWEKSGRKFANELGDAIMDRISA